MTFSAPVCWTGSGSQPPLPWHPVIPAHGCPQRSAAQWGQLITNSNYFVTVIVIKL